MGKYSSVSYNKPQVTPQSPVENPLRDTLPGSMPPGVSDSAGIEAARANAVADVPDNRQAASSAAMTDEEYNVDLSNERSGISQGPQPFKDAVQPDTSSVNRLGEPEDRDTMASRLARDRDREARRVGILTNDFSTQEELRENYSKSIKANDVGTLHRSALEIGDKLGNMDVSEGHVANAPRMTSGMSFLMNGTNRSAVQATNNVLVSSALMMPIVSGGFESSMEGGNDSVASFLAGDYDMGDVTKVEGAMLLSDATRLMGSLYMKISGLNKDVVDENGAPIDPQTVPRPSISTQEAGAVALQAAIDAKIFAKDKFEGRDVVVPHPLRGKEFAKASRAMGREVTDTFLEMSTSTPVSGEGMSTTAARNATNLGRNVKVNQQDTLEMAESIRILGHMPLVTSPSRAYIAAMMNNQAMATLRNDPTAIDAVEHANVYQDPEEDGDGKKLKQKVFKVMKELKGFAMHLMQGGTRFSRWWEDYTVHRLYQGANDVSSQRNMTSRAVMGGVSAPRLNSQVPIHKLGITRQMGKDFWRRTGEMVRKDAQKSYEYVNPLDREMAFLLTAAHALDVGPKTIGRPTASMLPEDILSQFTPQMMNEAAVFGRQIKSMLPNSKKSMADAIDNPATIEVSPAHKQILQRLINESDNKTWGFVASAYIDMADYIDSKERGIAFTPQMITSIDQNSAGRAFLAMDIGNQDLLERVGVLWNWEFEDRLANTLPHGNPRKYFMENALSSGVYNAINSSQGDLRETWIAVLKKYSTDNQKFVDDFGKKVLMTTDYGKPAMYHQAEASALLHKYPEFRDEMLTHYPDQKALVNGLNDIFTQSLYAATDVWQQAVPKNITQMLQMFDRAPSPEGYFGEKVGLGGFIDKLTGKSLKIQGEDKAEFVELTRRIQSALARAKNKGLKDEDGAPIPEPGEGSAAVNQVGPVLGQMRESILIALTLLHFNKGKGPKDIMFMLPVFDNLILSANSFPQVLYYANNVAAPKVFEWDIQGSFMKDFTSQTGEALAEIKKEGEADIGDAGKYRGTSVVLDREYGFLLDPKFGDGTLRPFQKKFLEFLESPSSGYLPADKRGATHVITPKQMEELFKQLYIFKFINDDGKVRVNRLIDWAKSGLEKKNVAMKKFNSIAQKGWGSFMT
jgi:hypothetical protein